MTDPWGSDNPVPAAAVPDGSGDRAPGQRADLCAAHQVPGHLLTNDTLHHLLGARNRGGSEREEAGKAQRSDHRIFSYRIVG